MEEHIKIILDAINSTQAALASAKGGIEGLNKAQVKATTIQQKMQSAATGTAKTLAAIATAAVAAGVALAAMAKHGIGEMEELKKQAINTRTTIEKLQKFKFAGEIGDIGGEQAVQNLKFLNKAIGEAADASSDAAHAFANLGITQEQLATEDTVEIALRVADGFKKYAGSVGLAEHANVLFGRGGKDTIAFFQQGGPEIRTTMEQLQQYGRLISEELAAKADTFNDNTVRMTESLKGIRTRALELLLPDLLEFQNRLLEVARDQEVTRGISVSLRDTFIFLAKALVYLVQGFRAIGIVIGGGLGLIINLQIKQWKGLGNIFMAVMMVIGNLIQRVWGLIKTLGGLGDVASKVLKRDFTGAWESVKGLTVDIGLEIQKVADTTSKDLAQAWRVAEGAVLETGDTVRLTLGGMVDDLGALGLEQQKLLAALDSKPVLKEGAAAVTTTSKVEKGPGGEIGPVTDKTGGISDEELDAMEQLDWEMVDKLSKPDQFAAFRVFTDGALSGAVGELSGGITAAVMGTESWSEAFAAVGKSILSNLINALVQIIIQAIILFGIVTALNAIAPGLGSALGGLLGLTAQAGAFGSEGHAEGGLVPGSPSKSDNRIARVATGEYIFDATSVARVGPGFFSGLHKSIRSGRVSGFSGGGRVGAVARSSFASGGLVGPAGSGGKVGVNVGMVNTRNQQREFMRKNGAKIVVDQMTGRGNTVLV